MFFELPWVGVAMDAMTVAIYIKYLVCQNAHITFYLLYYVRYIAVTAYIITAAGKAAFCVGLTTHEIRRWSFVGLYPAADAAELYKWTTQDAVKDVAYL